MLHYAVVFFVIALIAALFGFGGIAASAVGIAKARGAKRAILLPVSAPFHSSLMAPAARAVEEALAGLRLVAPAVPLVANVTAAPVTDPEEIRRLLVAQVTGAVRWRESVLAMAALGVTEARTLGRMSEERRVAARPGHGWLALPSSWRPSGRQPGGGRWNSQVSSISSPLSAGWPA